MISKTVAAECQLNTAIRLFFENRDNLSSYALAVASREVMDDVIQGRSKELYQRELTRVGDPPKVWLSYREEMKIRIKPEGYKGFLKLDRNWQNFLKHADCDPDAEIAPIKKKHLALTIISAIKNYTVLTQCWSVEMVTFFTWIAVAEPHLFKLEPSDETTKKVDELRKMISGDSYGSETLKKIYTAISTQDR